MTIFKYASAATIVALMFGIVAAALPFTASALNAPRCVLNTIVQPFNGGGTTLSWKVYDAHSINISGVGTVSDADSIVVYPSTTTTYTLTATGNGGVDTCTATAQAASSYSFINNTGIYGFGNVTNNQTCSAWVNPDVVVPGGTAVLSWNAGSASHVSISNGIGNVATTGSRVVPNTGVPQTFTVNARWGNGTTRTCSATVRPGAAIAAPTFTGGVNIPGAFVLQTPGVTLPGVAAPQVTAQYTPPTTAYVPLNQVPYTGTEDVAYVLTLLAVALGAFTLLYTKRGTITSAFASFSPTDNDDFETAVEQAVVYEA